MAQYDNTNSGFIGSNKKKESDKHPDITGFCDIEGVEYWVSGWKNAKGYGLKFKRKDAAQSVQQSAPSMPRGQQQNMDDDVPF